MASVLQDIDLKSLLYEAYHKGAQELLYVVPFVAKVLESCAKSKVSRSPRPPGRLPPTDDPSTATAQILTLFPFHDDCVRFLATRATIQHCHWLSRRRN